MAIPVNNKDLNHHSQMDQSDENLHYPKGFLASANGSISWRDADDNQAYIESFHFPSALDHVDGLVAPPTEVNDDIYLLQKSTVVYTPSSVKWALTDNYVQVTLSGLPDLSGIVVDDYIRVRGATNTEHNGTFKIFFVDDIADKITYTNTAISDGTLDETGAGPTCTTTFKDWGAVGDTDWVKYFANVSRWVGITPANSPIVFDKAGDRPLVFDASLGWVFYTVQNETNTDNMTKIFMSNNFN